MCDLSKIDQCPITLFSYKQYINIKDRYGKD